MLFRPSRRPVHRVVNDFLPVPSSDTFRAVYAYLLGVDRKPTKNSPHAFLEPGFGDHHALERALKAEGMDAEDIHDLKDKFKFSWYVQDFWRAVFLYLRGHSTRKVLERHKVDRWDIHMALKHLSEEQFGALCERAAFVTTYQVDKEVLDGIIRNVQKVCIGVAERKLKWIRDSDPAFNGADELMLEAARVALRYSYYPDPGRIQGCVIKSIYNHTHHLNTEHSKPDRRRSRKMPEFKCGECRKEFVHVKHVLNAKQAQTMLPTLDVSPGALEHVDCPYWCKSCAKKGKIAPLTPIVGDREYHAVVLSLDGGSNRIENRRIGDTIADPTLEGVDAKVLEKVRLSAVLGHVTGKSEKFLRILLDGDPKFEKWVSMTTDGPADDPMLLAQQICEFLRVPFEQVRHEIGRPLRPSVFQVRIGEETDEDDLVCAFSAKDAVDYVAKAYRFVDGRNMRDALDTTIKVRCVDPFQQKYTAMRPGQVTPLAQPSV